MKHVSPEQKVLNDLDNYLLCTKHTRTVIIVQQGEKKRLVFISEGSFLYSRKDNYM